MNSIKIYTCHHKPSAFLNASIIKPLHVGKANSYNDIGCIGDDTGDNISFKNPFYCELTAHYWVWKNESLSDYGRLYALSPTSELFLRAELSRR